MTPAKAIDKKHKMVEEMVSNIKSHVSVMTLFVNKQGKNVGSFIVECCGLFHPVRVLFHFNPYEVDSYETDGYIREVVYLDTREDKGGYVEGIAELINRIDPMFRKWGYPIRGDCVLDVFAQVKTMGFFVVPAL